MNTTWRPSLPSWAGGRASAPKRAPASRLALPAPQAETGLRFTEVLLLAVLALAYLLSTSQPVFGVQLHLTILNHFPAALLGPVLLVHLLGLMLTRAPPPWSETFAAVWPLVLLALYALVGSAVAKWAFKERDTYLTFGVYVLLLPLFVAAVPQQVHRLRGWVLVLISIWVVASLAALAGEGARIKVKESLHEIEYIVTCGFFVLFYAVRHRGLKAIALMALLAAALINSKLTGYIIAVLALLHIVVGTGWRRLPPQWRGAYGTGAVVFTLAVALTLTLLYFEYRQFLPSGNVDVRLKQYEAAMRQFIESPIWGSAYTAGSGEAYRESFRVLNIPTHSDVLDVLKHGGLIGFALFCWGYWKIFALINRAVSATRSDGLQGAGADSLLNAYFVGVRFFAFTALVTFSLNPLLLKGPFLIVIWGNLGLGVGMALTATRAATRAAKASAPA